MWLAKSREFHHVWYFLLSGTQITRISPRIAALVHLSSSVAAPLALVAICFATNFEYFEAIYSVVMVLASDVATTFVSVVFFTSDVAATIFRVVVLDFDAAVMITCLFVKHSKGF